MEKLENIFTDIAISLDDIKIIYDQRWEHWEVRYPEGGISCHSSLEEAVVDIKEYKDNEKNKTCYLPTCNISASWSIQHNEETLYSCNEHIGFVIKAIRSNQNTSTETEANTMHIKYME
jgi:hypothetical protein